jgi:hypothetical protein
MIKVDDKVNLLQSYLDWFERSQSRKSVNYVAQAGLDRWNVEAVDSGHYRLSKGGIVLYNIPAKFIEVRE